MDDGIVKTGVDELLELLKRSSKIALSDAAKKLGVSNDAVQAWVDFLVEERIVGIEYRFTTPFIYLNKAIETEVAVDAKNEDALTILFFKKEFLDRAIKNKMPENQIDKFWKNHLLSALDLKKKYFFFEAQQRSINHIDDLWIDYQNTLLSY